VKVSNVLPQYDYVYNIDDKDNKVSFYVSSSDNDGDNVSFHIDWGDDTKENTSNVETDEVLTINHSWKDPGIYFIEFTTKDNVDALSEPTKIVILLNLETILIDDDLTGYLIDYTGNGTYSSFFDVSSDEEIMLSTNDQGEYLFDQDNDQTWDYIYNTSSGLRAYQSEKIDDENDENTDTPGFELLMILCSLIILFIIRRKKR
jgi:hypothetical protein